MLCMSNAVVCVCSLVTVLMLLYTNTLIICVIVEVVIHVSVEYSLQSLC